MKTSFVCLLSAVVLTGITLTPLQAAVVYDNGGPAESVYAYNIYEASNVSDDFTLTGSSSVSGVGFYFNNLTGISGWNQDIAYAILDDDSNQPGSTVIASGVGQNLSAVDSGLPWSGGQNAYLVTFDLEDPVILTAGVRYWLRLTGATGGSDAFWITAAGSSSTSGLWTNGVYQNNRQTAFYLVGEPIPEPGTLSVLAGGGLLFALLRRRLA